MTKSSQDNSLRKEWELRARDRRYLGDCLSRAAEHWREDPTQPVDLYSLLKLAAQTLRTSTGVGWMYIAVLLAGTNLFTLILLGSLLR